MSWYNNNICSVYTTKHIKYNMQSCKLRKFITLLRQDGMRFREAPKRFADGSQLVDVLHFAQGKSLQNEYN